MYPCACDLMCLSAMQGGTQTNQTRNVTDSNTDTTREGTSYMGAGGQQVSQSKNTTNTVDESTKESSEHFQRGGGVRLTCAPSSACWTHAALVC